MRNHIKGSGRAVTLATALLIVGLAAPVRAGIVELISITGSASGSASTAALACSFNSQTNTLTFTITNTSSITQPGSTSTITGIGFDLPPIGNAAASGLNGFTGNQAPSLSSSFDFSDADLGNVPGGFNSVVLDFGFTTGVSGTFGSGDVDEGLLPGESASFTVSGAAFSGFTEAQICNAIFVRFLNVPTVTTDVGVPQSVLAFQPDARIKRSGGALKGNDVYNTTGAGQTVALTPPGGTVRRVYVTIQNDGEAADSFSLATTGDSPAGYQLRYFFNRTNVELTAAVENDTFVTPVLDPGETYRIRVRVLTTVDAQQSSVFTRLFTFTSQNDSAEKDAVKLTVSRT